MCFKSLKVMALSALLATASFGLSEGVEYQKLANPIPNADKTLIKVYNYGCSFSYKFDKAVTPIIVSKLPSEVEFRPFHLNKREFAVPASELFAVAILKDKESGIKSLYDEKSLYKKAKVAYFKAYHDKKEKWEAGAEAFLQTGLDAIGMNKEAFSKEKENPKVKSLVKEWDVASDIAKIQGGVSYVVNGKYLINTPALTSPEKAVEIVNELLAM